MVQRSHTESSDAELRVNNFCLLRGLFPGLTVGSLCPGFSLIFHSHFTVAAEVQLMHPGTELWMLGFALISS